MAGGLGAAGPVFQAQNPGGWSQFLSILITPSDRPAVVAASTATAAAQQITVANTGSFYPGAVIEIDRPAGAKTYHEVAQPVALLRNLRAALRPGAKVGVIDRNGNGEDHGVGRDVVIREAKEAGYELLKQYDFVKGDKMDYFLVFTARP